MTYVPHTNTIYVDDTQGSTIRGLGQLFIRVLKDIAELPDCPVDIVNDWEIIKKWLGPKNNLTKQADYRIIGLAWQSYYASYDAPSPNLEELFKIAKTIAIQEKWMIIKIPADIKAVFDRLITTEDNIKKAEDASKSRPIKTITPIKQKITIGSSILSNATYASYKLLAAIALLLFIAVLDMPYGYYTFVKIITCGCAGYICYQAMQNNYKGLWLPLWAVVAILFNPLAPIHLSKEIWAVIDGLTAIIFSYWAYRGCKK